MLQAVINKMRGGLCDKLHGGPSQLLLALHQSSIRQPDIGRESRFLFTPSAFEAPLRVSLSDYCHNVSYSKLECGYPTVKKIWKYICSLRQNTWTCQSDRQTDRQTPHNGIGRAYAYHRAAKLAEVSLNKCLTMAETICPCHRAVKTLQSTSIALNTFLRLLSCLLDADCWETKRFITSLRAID